MTRRDVKLAIEACRPGSDDLSLPEMTQLADALQRELGVRQLYERTQRCDAVIATVVRDVAVPEQLAQRLLDAVGEAAEEQGPPVVDQSPPVPAGRVDQSAGSGVPGRQPGHGRRRWLRVAVPLIAVSLSLLFTIGYLAQPRPEPKTTERLRAEVHDWREQIVRNGWRNDLAAAPLNDRPLTGDIVAKPRRWCRIATRYDSAAVVYDLAGPDRPFAHVYCMRIDRRHSDLSTTPPLTPYRPTGRVSLGVWRRGQMVYVLAVEGGAERYGEFLNSSILFS
jgi:hypothetical protein